MRVIEQVLSRDKTALEGVEAIQNVRSETRHGEMEKTGVGGKVTFVAYSKLFRTVGKTSLPNGAEFSSGFDGELSWSVTRRGAHIDKDTPVESVRGDADLQYGLHTGERTADQFYDVETGLLAGYKFQSDRGRPIAVTILVFEDYKSFGGALEDSLSTCRLP